MINMTPSASQTEKKLNLAYANLRVRGGLYRIWLHIYALRARLYLERLWARLWHGPRTEVG